MARLLLVSNSTNPGEGYLDHCAAEIRTFLGEPRDALFVPYALHDLDAYAATAAARFERLGIPLRSIHTTPDPRAAVAAADALFVGGGNTFRLLDRIARAELLDPIRERVAAGTPYLGTSAGCNLACPTIKTTNDMPIVEVPSFEALGLIRFQINPHYADRDPDVAHGGETREQRIAEFLEENDATVVGLREGSMLRIDGATTLLVGPRPARVFRRGLEPLEVDPGTDLTSVFVEGAHPAAGEGQTL